MERGEVFLVLLEFLREILEGEVSEAEQLGISSSRQTSFFAGISFSASWRTTPANASLSEDESFSSKFSCSSFSFGVSLDVLLLPVNGDRRAPLMRVGMGDGPALLLFDLLLDRDVRAPLPLFSLSSLTIFVSVSLLPLPRDWRMGIGLPTVGRGGLALVKEEGYGAGALADEAGHGGRVSASCDLSVCGASSGVMEEDGSGSAGGALVL